MPTPSKGENKSDFVSRCIPIVLDDGTADGNDQAVAICNSMWDDAHKASEMVRDYIVGEFRGDFPTIPVDGRVDVTALTKGDEDPFFVTLPIARVGETSANGLLYDEELVTALQQQVVGRGGTMGHLKPEERDTAFPVEDVDWVGVQRVGDTAWAKGYVPPGEAREYIRRLMARKGQLATSIYGPFEQREPLQGGGWRAKGFRLEQLDLAPADRAALKLGGQFAVTAQMQTEPEIEEENDMGTKEEWIAELTAGDIPQTVREQIVQEWQAQSDTQNQIAELTKERDAAKTQAAELQTQVEQYLVREFDARLDARVAELIDWQVKGEDAQAKLDSLKGQLKARILAEMGADRTVERITEIGDKVWAELKPLAEMVRDALAGPHAVISGKVRNSRQIEDTPEARRRARQAVGI